MKPRMHRALGVRAFVVALACAPLAHAQDALPAAVPVASGAEASIAHFDMFARGSYVTPPVQGGVTPFGTGGGGGLGLALGPVYLAGSVLYFSGGSDDTGASEHAWLYGGEVGYELRPAPRFTLRPFFGAGGASITSSFPNAAAATTSTTVPRSVADSLAQPDVITQATSSSSGTTTSSTGRGSSRSNTTDTVVSTYFVEPGLAAIYATPSGVYAGVRASVLYFPSVKYDASTSASWLPYSLGLQIGQRF